MRRRLDREEIVAIQALTKNQVPNRQIARQLGIGESLVRYHQKRQAEGAQDGRADKAMKAEALAVVIEHWWAENALGDRPPNVQELHEHLRRAHGYAGSYKSVLRYVRRRWGKPRIRTYRRVETPPGAQAQSDWGHYKGIWIGGEKLDPFNFAMTLSWSRGTALVWSLRKDQVSWLSVHNSAFRRLGGIPAVNRIDNEKTAMSRGAGVHGMVHPVYAAYARSVGFLVDPCAPRQPQAKGKSEAKVKLGRRLGPKRKHYDALEELQEETDDAVAAWAKRTICPATGLSVMESWEQEREHLAELPALLPEPFDVLVVRPVHPDCRVHFEGRQYSVPFQHVGRTVEVRGCAGRVQILLDGTVLREYPRHTAERILVDPSCYEGESTDRVLAPTPLGKLGSRLEQIYAMPVEQRPVDLYADLAEVQR